MHRTITAVVAVAILAVGCATIVPLDVDGSRSDGTILMAAETTLGDTVDWQAGSQVALDKCLAWGYHGVEPFSGIRTFLVDEMTLFGPRRLERLERKYQCTTWNKVDGN